MKAAEAKPASKQGSKSSNPFFNKGGSALFSNEMANDNGSFFSPQQNSFFKANTSTIQTKLTIGQPNDKYEQEADLMADKVVQRVSENKSEIANKDGNTIQTKA